MKKDEKKIASYFIRVISSSLRRSNACPTVERRDIYESGDVGARPQVSVVNCSYHEAI